MSDWIAGGAVGLALGVALVVYLMRSLRSRIEVGYTVGSALLVVGALTADVTRLWDVGPQPWLALGGSMASVSGLILAVSSTHRPWRELICDAFLIGGGVVLAALSVAALVTDVVDDAWVSSDVASLIIAALAAMLVPRLSRSVALRSVDQGLTVAYFWLRTAAWGIVAAGSLGVVDVDSLVPRVAAITGFVVLGIISVRQRASPVPPVVNHQEVPQRVLPFVITAAAAGITGIGMAFDRGLATTSIVLLTFGVAIVMVIRQIVTWMALRSTIRASLEREEYFRTLVQDATDVIVIAAPNGALEYVSPAASHVMGITDLPERASIVDLVDLGVEDFRAAVACLETEETVRVDATRGDRVYEASLRRRDGRVLMSLRDVTERELMRRHLHDLAYSDALTGLANRSQLLTMLEDRLDDGDRAGRTAVLFVDLDRFKPINDASGHGVGDVVLRQVADRVRRMAGADGFVARQGGDEFVLVTDTRHVDAVALARRVAAAVLNAPFNVSGRQYRLGASVGVALGEPGVGAAELIRRADVAMFAAKRSGDGVTVYEPSMGLAAETRLVDESEAAVALARRSFLAYLQPIVNVSTGDVAWCESLLRWVGRDGTVRTPGPLLQYSAQVDRTVSVTWWMIRAAVDRLAQTPGRRTPIAVNIPPSMLAVPSLPDDIEEVLAARGVPAERLVLEITEEAMVEHGRLALDVIEGLDRTGLRLHVDDFGTGYSSLSYLIRLPVSAVKIDRAFTADLPTSRASRSVVRGLVGLAEELGLRVVGEGVETPEQHEWLVRLGVRYAQGYWYARPESSAEIDDIAFLGSWSTARTAVP